MKKIYAALVVILVSVLLTYCTSSKKSQATENAGKISYTENMQPIISANCSPCHFPPKGTKLALDNYGAAKTNIDDIISRINKNPSEKGFMPFKHEKLSDSTIQLFVKWKNDGLIEK